MTRKIFFILALMIPLLPANAEDKRDSTRLTWGSRELLPSSEIMPRIIGYDESGYYALSYDYNWAVEHYDTKLRRTEKQHLDLMNKLRTRNVEALVHFHGVLYLFTSEQRYDRMLLYVETIDKKTLKQNGDDRIFMDMKNISGWMADFGFRLSKKENKLLVYGKIITYWQKFQVLNWGVYDEGLTKVWENRDEIKYRRIPRDEYEMLVDESGNAFFINLYWDPKFYEIFQPQKNIYQIITRTNNGEDMNEYYADFKGKYIRGIGIASDDENTLACSGFYSPAQVREKIDGIFFFNIDLKNGSVRDRKFHEFDKFFVTEAMSLKPGNNFNELLSFSLDYFEHRANGNYIMAAQQIWEQNYDSYNNIILVCLSRDGEILWDRTIEKSQNHDFNATFNYSSYCLLAPPDKNKVDIVYNEHLKNLEPDEGARYKNFNYNSKAYLKHVEVGAIGQIATSAIYLKNKKRMLTPLPVMYYDMKNDETVIPALRFRKLKFLKISFGN